MSYARFGEDLTPPSGKSIAECDLCMNTIYVRPDAFPLFECAKDGKKQLYPDLAVYKRIAGGHNNTEAQYLRKHDGKTTDVDLGITPNGMMCMCLSDIYMLFLTSVSDINP